MVDLAYSINQLLVQVLGFNGVAVIIIFLLSAFA